MNERRTRRFSEAISEGDGISVLVQVEDAAAAGAAEAQGAEGIVVRGALAGVRAATELPILWCSESAVDAATAAGADACLLVASAFRDDWDALADAAARARELGLECVVEARDEEELERALERVDPEIVLLSARSTDSDDGLDHVLELLPDVPAGKLAVAEVDASSREDVVALERAGIDAVVVRSRDVTALVGDAPPAV